MIVGTVIGGFVPTLFGESAFSVLSVITTAIGGGLGIWAGFKIANW